jgi:hypothetical protein
VYLSVAVTKQAKTKNSTQGQMGILNRLQGKLPVTQSNGLLLFLDCANASWNVTCETAGENAALGKTVFDFLEF